jgi:hypothetical protein
VSHGLGLRVRHRQTLLGTNCYHFHDSEIHRKCTLPGDVDGCNQYYGYARLHQDRVPFCGDDIEIQISDCTAAPQPPPPAPPPPPPPAPANCAFWAQCGGAVSVHCDNEADPLTLYRNDMGVPEPVASTSATATPPAVYLTDSSAPQSLAIGVYQVCAVDAWQQSTCTGPPQSVTLDFSACSAPGSSSASSSGSSGGGSSGGGSSGGGSSGGGSSGGWHGTVLE